MPYNNLISRTDVAAMIRETVSDMMMGGLTTESAALTMFRSITVPTNQTRFPIISALPTAYFVSGDTGLKQTTEVNWSNKYIDIEELAAIVPVPDAVLADSSFDIFGTVRPLLEQAIGRALDAAVFFDTNAPAAWPDGVVAAADAAGNEVFRGTTAANAGGLIEDVNLLMGELLEDGYAATGFIGNPLFQTRLRSARGSDGQLLMDQNGNAATLWGVPVSYPMPAIWPTGLSAAELIVMQRENFIIGVRQDFTFTIHNEGVITDNSGAIVYNLMQQDMTAIRVVFRVGWQVANPINYQQSTEGNRYPAAVLRAPAA
jgi:HK97 family phage major capsid protein